MGCSHNAIPQKPLQKIRVSFCFDVRGAHRDLDGGGGAVDLARELLECGEMLGQRVRQRHHALIHEHHRQCGGDWFCHTIMAVQRVIAISAVLLQTHAEY